ncbi:hypothetical protein AN958_03485 [Leucoagaricus sp. SymC.cos]|nr:hypothetical protein AN958_03485 [Leucoagaricus sp. SymC.cos]
MSQSSTTHLLPPLLGGYPLKRDLVPSIICSALYASLLPLFLYRVCRKSTRTSVLSAIAGLIIERSIMFGLRAGISNEPRNAQGFQESEGLMEYLQTTLFMGIVPVAQDLSYLVRTILVNASYGSEAIKEIPRLQEYLKPSNADVETATKISTSCWRDDAISMKTWQPETKSVWSFSGTTIVPDEDVNYPDEPRRRFWFRRMHGGFQVLFVVIFVTGLVGNNRLVAQRDNLAKSRENEILRYVSTALSVLVFLFMNSVVVWALVAMPRMNRKATKYVFLVSALMIVPAIYRFTVVAQKTTVYWAYENSAQNDVKDKALFYIINVMPEWLAVFILLRINVREVFQTGIEGDSRRRDETPAEKEKRLLREKEKELKNGNGLITVPVISKLSRGRYVTPLISS